MTDTTGELRMRLSPGAAVGVTEAMIDAQVRAFYGKIQNDPMLGPIFSRVVEDWEVHLLRMVDFWSSVLLTTGRYKGRPVPKHMPLNLEPAHFERWLRIFGETAHEICPPAAAALFMQKAKLIAESLQISAGLARGELIPRVL